MLAACAALLAAPAAHGQTTLPPDVNFFGDSAGLQIQRPPSRPATTDKIAAVSPYLQTLMFTDGRELRGELVEINKDEVIWRRADAGEPLRFARSEMRRIVMAAGQPSPDIDGKASQIAPVFATLKLPGGDWLFGDVRSGDGQSFQMQLDEGAQLTVTRPQIEWMQFGQTPAPAFGFSGAALEMEGWMPAAAAMEVVGKTLTVKGASWIGRMISPPKRFEVSFELPEDGEEGTRLWLQPFGPQPNCYGTGTAEIRFGKKEISRLLFIDKFDYQPVPLPKEALEDKGPPKYRVFYDSVEKRIIVQRNGRQVGDWKYFEKKEAEVKGGNPNFQFNGICFDRQDRGQGPAPLRFNRLRMQPWDGILPKEGDAADNQDRLSTGDTPSVTGQLESITEKELGFSGASQARQAGAFIRLSGAASAPLAEAEAKLEFGNRGEFTARHLEIRDGKLRCETSFASALELPLRTVHCITFQAHPQPAPSPADMLVFKNGDELFGKCLSASLPGSVRWRMTTGQEMEFQPGRLAGIRLAGAHAPKSATTDSSAATVELRSGERLRGTLLGFDGKQLRLEHPLLGSLTLARGGLWHLFPNPRLNIVDGGCAPGSWISSRDPAGGPNEAKKSASADHWIYADGTYILRSDGNAGVFNSTDAPALQQEINPELERFEVRIESASLNRMAPNFLLKLNGKNGASLSASLSYNELQVSVTAANGRRQSRWREIPLVEKLGNTNMGRALRLFVDTRTGTCDIVINDVFIARLGHDEHERLSKSPYSLRIQPYPNSGAPDVFSNLWIGPWSGDLSLAGRESDAATAFANGDVIAGTPKVMRDGKLKIDCELGELDLPVEKALAVDFGGMMDKQPVAARFRFADGTIVNVDRFAWDGHELTAHSPLLGDLRLPVDAVNELIFDPALPRPPGAVSTKKVLEKDSENNATGRILP